MIISINVEKAFDKVQHPWEGDARGKRYGDICRADSLCYTAETNTPL